MNVMNVMNEIVLASVNNILETKRETTNEKLLVTLCKRYITSSCCCNISPTISCKSDSQNKFPVGGSRKKPHAFLRRR